MTKTVIVEFSRDEHEGVTKILREFGCKNITRHENVLEATFEDNALAWEARKLVEHSDFAICIDELSVRFDDNFK